MLACGLGALAHASTTIGSGLIAGCVAVVPLMVCGWGLLSGQRLGGREWAGIAVGIIGVTLLARGDSFSAAPSGLLLMLFATLAWSLGSVLSTGRLPLAAGATGFASEMLCGGALLALASVAAGERFTWPPTAQAFAAWAYLVVAGSLIAFSAYLYLLAHASPALATSYAFVNPVIALALGAIVGGEAITAGEWGASVVVLSGVVLIAWPRRPLPARATPDRNRSHPRHTAPAPQ